MDKNICMAVASIYAGKNLHKLTNEEAYLVRMLEVCGYIIPNNPADGLVGKAVQ